MSLRTKKEKDKLLWWALEGIACVIFWLAIVQLFIIIFQP